MRNDTRVAVGFLVLGAGNVIACAVDDSVVQVATTSGGGAGATTSGTAGKAGTTTSTTSAGGKGGAGGVATGGGSAGTAGGKAGSAGSGGTAGGMAGAGGQGGTGMAGTGGTGVMDGGFDDVPEIGSGGAGPDASDAPAPDACMPETDGDFCVRNHKNCGSFLGQDNCGMSRAVLACGRCPGAEAVCGSAGTLNTCPGTELQNRAQGGTVLSTNPTSPPVFAVEGDLKVFDNDITTKWYVRGNPTPTIAYDFGGSNSYAINAYTVTSGNDSPDRDPLSWRIEGSNSPTLTTWTVVDTRTNEMFAARNQTNFYSFNNTTGYVVYRFVVTANNGNTLNGGEFQVAEIQLFGDPAPPPDAGSDALPPGPDAGADTSSGADTGADTSLE